MIYTQIDDLIVGVWVTCTTLAMTYMPSQLVKRIYQDRAVGDASIIPLVTLQGISHNWMLYGFMTKTWFPSFPVFLVGDIAATCYLFVYWRYSPDRQRIACIIALVYSILAIPTMYVIIGGLGYTNQTRAEVANTQGHICGVVMTSLHLVMLQTLVQVVRQKSTASLKLRALMAGTANTSGWLTFGMLTSNWIIITPNVFVTGLHVTALILYAAFRPRRSSSLRCRTASNCRINIAVDINMSPTALKNASPVYETVCSPISV